MSIHIGQVLHQPAIRHPGRVAVVDAGEAPAEDASGVRQTGIRAGDGSPAAHDRDSVRREATYGDLDAAALRIAAALREAGVPPGAPVGLMAANGVPFVETWFGIAYAGSPVVPVPILSAAPEVAFRLQKARCAALVVDGPRRAVAERAARDLDLPLLDPGALTAAPPLPRPAPPAEIAMILHTSGTTGRPKAALISHAALLLHTSVLVHHTLRLTEAERIFGALPLTHSFGCRMVMLAGFYAGGRAVLVPRFDAARTMEIMAREQVTWLPAVPTMFAAWADLPDGPRSDRLRWCLAAGAPLPEELARRAEVHLGAEVRQGYGLTEATFSTIDAPPEPRTSGSVGRPVWGVELRVVDADDRDLPPGEEGQVLVRGHNAMSGYLDDPQATAEVTRGGWIHTGDVGRLDAAGRLTLVDRLKDLIIRGGNNVYPAEVEEVLAAHPAVAEVAVVGRPDDYYGEEVVAVVVPRTGARLDPETLHGWARERVARTKVPREIVVVEALPLGPSGKVVKNTLRARLARGELRPDWRAPRKGRPRPQH